MSKKLKVASHVRMRLPEPNVKVFIVIGPFRNSRPLQPRHVCDSDHVKARTAN